MFNSLRGPVGIPCTTSARIAAKRFTTGYGEQMLIMVPRWHVNVELSSGKKVQLWISDNHIENVLRKVADIAFDVNPTVRVERVTVGIPQSLDAADPVGRYSDV